MSINATWRSSDPVEFELKSVSGSHITDCLEQAPSPIFATKFAEGIIHPAHSATRHVRVEQKRPPHQLDGQIGPAHLQQAQSVYSKIAPRTDEVEDDFDDQSRLSWCNHVHWIAI